MPGTEDVAVLLDSFLTRNACILLGLSLLAGGLIAGRGRMVGRRIRPMLWNLLLAWTPMLLVMTLDVIVVDSPDRVVKRVAVTGFVVVISLLALFLPNSSYLITELAHLREADERIPTWYDVIAFVVSTPQFPHAVVSLGAIGRRQGGTLRVDAPGTSADRRFIASASIDGRAIPRTWLTRSAVAHGGRLAFKLSARPTRWGTATGAAPPSVTRSR